MDEGVLYPFIDNFYLPVSYMAFKNYHTSFTELLYLKDSKEKFPYIRVDTLQETNKRNSRDFLLTGGFKDETELDWKTPDVSLDEITSLYQNFIKEGASKEEAINLILNYYRAKRLPLVDGYVNTTQIFSKEKIKILKKDNSVSKK